MNETPVTAGLMDIGNGIDIAIAVSRGYIPQSIIFNRIDLRLKLWNEAASLVELIASPVTGDQL